MQKLMWFFSGLMAGLTALSITKAAVIPSKSRVNQVAGDSMIYQNALSEINVKKQSKLSFDSDIHQLASLEKRYQEKLPLRYTSGRLGKKKVKSGVSKAYNKP